MDPQRGCRLRDRGWHITDGGDDFTLDWIEVLGLLEIGTYEHRFHKQARIVLTDDWDCASPIVSMDGGQPVFRHRSRSIDVEVENQQLSGLVTLEIIGFSGLGPRVLGRA